jgi:RHS repeat-associated protein
MGLGLYYYQARFYAPGLGRFLSADTIVPDPQNPQSFNRYSYVENRPLNMTDVTGHCGADFTEAGEMDQALYEQCLDLRDFLEGQYSIDIDGIWKFIELSAFGHGLFDLKTGMGGIKYFRAAFAGTRVYRDRSKWADGKNIATTGAGEPILFYNGAFQTFDVGRWATIHEFGHVFDFGRNTFQLLPDHPWAGYARGIDSIGRTGQYSSGFDFAIATIVSKYALKDTSEDYAEAWAAYFFQGSWNNIGNTRYMGGDPHSRNIVLWEPRNSGSAERRNYIARNITTFQLTVDQTDNANIFL